MNDEITEMEFTDFDIQIVVKLNQSPVFDYLTTDVLQRSCRALNKSLMMNLLLIVDWLIEQMKNKVIDPLKN